MDNITFANKQILILNKNQQLPNPIHNDLPSFAIRKDTAKQYWLYAYHKQHWILVSGEPFTTQRLASEAANTFDFTELYNLYN
ncbi:MULTISPECIES: hypothetical protein [unclassified Serratia (in: enterobacteria)]|uniref:hypothetical protein n=1 Tax=unclassified Serratia (in: enterobacteria) TaxID=2647522 RepID=UPI0027EE8943|nr:MULTISPECIES: hypothetical protein [unclassified Serratia (in: enterobacteria)]MDQ7099393.1 hypothetical protein [Serratia sp. MF2]MDQ7102198.1 hypothetical protein [Serratia sp. MF1(2023)]